MRWELRRDSPIPYSPAASSRCRSVGGEGSAIGSRLTVVAHIGCSLNSSKAGYTGDYIGEYYRAH